MLYSVLVQPLNKIFQQAKAKKKSTLKIKQLA